MLRLQDTVYQLAWPQNKLSINLATLNLLTAGASRGAQRGECGRRVWAVRGGLSHSSGPWLVAGAGSPGADGSETGQPGAQHCQPPLCS